MAYTKQNFVDKQVLTHTHLNNIENGIVEISELVDTLPVANGGTGFNSIVDTIYTTARYRASSLHSAETTPNNNGVICWMYE